MSDPTPSKHLLRYGHEKIAYKCGKCVVCSNQRYAENREQVKARIRAYRQKHPDKTREVQARYNETHKEERRKAGAARYARDPGKKKAYNAKYVQDHREQILAQGRSYYWANREAIRARAAIYAEANKERARERDAAYGRAHRAEKREYNRAYHAANPDKARTAVHRRRALKNAAPGAHTPTDVRRQLEAQRGRCYWCKKPMGAKYQVDHVIPISKGGSNGRENIVMACRPCNSYKRAKMPSEFAGILL
jgi:5-methylcytosine-specific restriction endonuclease McrA